MIRALILLKQGKLPASLEFLTEAERMAMLEFEDQVLTPMGLRLAEAFQKGGPKVIKEEALRDETDRNPPPALANFSSKGSGAGDPGLVT